MKTVPTPDIVNNEHYAAPLQAPPLRTKRWRRQPPPSAWMSLARDQEEAIAEALARPLGVQSGIDNHCRLFPHIASCQGVAFRKLRPPLGSTAVSAVGWRRCSSSRIGGGGLLKAPQESSLARYNGHWPLNQINNYEAPWRRWTQEPSVLCICV